MSVSLFWETEFDLERPERKSVDYLKSEIEILTANRKPRIFLLDDDPVFCSQLAKVAKKCQIPLTTCSKVADLNFYFNEDMFDVAVIDYHLDALTGTQVAKNFSKTPVLLVSRTGLWIKGDQDWPNSVRDFVHKKFGVFSILVSALRIGRS